jgi:hypothetical protein
MSNIVRPPAGANISEVLAEMVASDGYPKELHLQRGSTYVATESGTINNMDGLKIKAVGNEDLPRPVVSGLPESDDLNAQIPLLGDGVTVRDIKFVNFRLLSSDGSSNFVVENCEFDRSNVWLDRVVAGGGTNYVRNCTFFESPFDGIDLFGPDTGSAINSPLIVEDCFFERVGTDTANAGSGDAVSIHKLCPDVTIRRCVFLNCAAGIGRQQHTSGDLVVDQCLVIQNLDENGLEQDYNPRPAEIVNRPGCYTYELLGALSYAGATSTIKNSIFLFKFDPDFDTLQCRSCIRILGDGGAGAASSKTYIKHNLFVNYSTKSSFPAGPGTLSAAYTPASIFYRQDSAPGANQLLHVDNNIFLAPNGGTHICVDIIDDPNVPSDFALAYTGDNNLFFPATGDVFGEVSAAALGSRYLAFTGSPGWLEITLSSPWTHNNVLTDPGLIDDLSLDPIELMPAVRSGGGASGVIDAGSDQTSTVPIDFWGNERQTTSDIGPFEMNGATPLGHLERLIRIFDSGPTKRFEIRLDMAANETVTVPVAQPIDPGKVTMKSVTLSDNTNNSCVLRDGHSGPVITSVAAGGTWSDDITLPPGHPLIAEFSTGATAGEVSMVVEYEISPEASNERRAMIRSYLDGVSDPRRHQGL